MTNAQNDIINKANEKKLKIWPVRRPHLNFHYQTQEAHLSLGKGSAKPGSLLD